jgi:hypothetical protein
MPVSGESFVFTQFSGQPQCFLTAEELITEMAAAGFALDLSHPLRELNRAHGALSMTGAPVIYEGVFRCGPDPTVLGPSDRPDRSLHS